MYVHTYDFELTNHNGETTSVSLRLTAGKQIELKKKWKESTTTTLFNAADDIERFADVMDAALKFKDNQNAVKSGAELIDLMADNNMLGMVERQKILTSLGMASGLFSEKEKAAIDARTDRMIETMFGDGEDDSEAEDEKNG